jgi:hypothetical protein
MLLHSSQKVIEGARGTITLDAVRGLKPAQRYIIVIVRRIVQVYSPKPLYRLPANTRAFFGRIYLGRSNPLIGWSTSAGKVPASPGINAHRRHKNGPDAARDNLSGCCIDRVRTIGMNRQFFPETHKFDRQVLASDMGEFIEKEFGLHTAAIVKRVPLDFSQRSKLGLLGAVKVSVASPSVYEVLFPRGSQLDHNRSCYTCDQRQCDAIDREPLTHGWLNTLFGHGEQVHVWR